MPTPNQIDQVSADDIAGDIVTYLYDQHPGASYIGDKEGQDGSVMLRFDWGKEDQAAIQNELKERYGERIAFTGGQLKYAPEIKLSFIRVLPVQPLTEAVNSNKAKTSITAVGKLELYAGDFSTQFFAEVYSKDGWTEELAIDLAAEIEKQFKPGEIETEYLSPMDNMNDNRGGCTYQIVMNMNISISLSALDSRVQGAMYKFQSVPTLKYNDEGDNQIERQVADNIDTAMMDHYDMMNGDIGDVFESSVKNLCGKAGKPALAEAVIKLFNVYKPVMEAVEDKPHVIPEEIAKAVNDAQAADYGWRPETAEREFNETWDWLEDHADTVLDAWNANNDPREVVRAIEGEEERLVCQFDGI